MKKLISLLICMTLFSAPMIVAAEGMPDEMGGDQLPDVSKYQSRTMVDGKYVKLPTQPIIDHKTAYLPLKDIMEKAGYQVKWDAATKSIVMKSAAKGYTFNVTKGKFEADGKAAIVYKDYTNKNGKIFVLPDFFSLLPNPTVSWDRVAKTAIIRTATPGNLVMYNLGQGILKDKSSNREVKYSMQGIIGVPKVNNAPVAIIIHGAHPMEKAADNRYDLGFSYLVDSLSQAGYLTISLNVGINYSFEAGEPVGRERTLQIVEQQISHLKDAIEGKKNDFGIALKNKGDLNKVVLIGHSRGAADIFDIAKTSKLIHPIGLLSIAPSLTTELAKPYVDVPTSIILPQYDGDVSELDGGILFEELKNSNKKSGVEQVYLHNADHGGFNSAILPQDPYAKPENLKLLMPREQERSFLQAYAVHFMDAVTKHGITPQMEKPIASSSLGNVSELITTYTPNDKYVVNANTIQANEFKQLTSRSTAKVKQVSFSSIPGGTAGNFKPPGTFKHYGLINATWNQKNQKVVMDFPNMLNLANKKQLIISLAQDSTSALNHRMDQGMTVALTDQAGHRTVVKVPKGNPALSYQKGDLKQIKEWDGSVTSYFSTFTPISDLKIDLTSFGSINVSHVKSLELSFTDSDSGNVMIKDIKAR